MRVSEILLISYRTHTNNHHLHGEHQTPQTRRQRANVKPSGLCNKLLYSSIWGLGKFPHILLRQSLATVRRPALNEMSSGHNVIPSWTRTRSMYLFYSWSVSQ